MGGRSESSPRGHRSERGECRFVVRWRQPRLSGERGTSDLKRRGGSTSARASGVGWLLFRRWPKRSRRGEYVHTHVYCVRRTHPAARDAAVDAAQPIAGEKLVSTPRCAALLAGGTPGRLPPGSSGPHRLRRESGARARRPRCARAVNAARPPMRRSSPTPSVAAALCAVCASAGAGRGLSRRGLRSVCAQP